MDRLAAICMRREGITRPDAACRLFLPLAAFFAMFPLSVLASEWLPSGLVHPDTPFPEAGTDVAVGPDGIPFVVWDYGEIWWVRWDEGCSCWSTPGTVNAPNTVADEYPRISIGSDGVPWVIWCQSQPGQGTSALLSSRYQGGSWTSPDTVLIPSGGNDVFEIVALGQADAWVASQAFPERIFVGHYENGGWVSRGSFDVGDGYHTSPTIAVDASGSVWVAWGYFEAAEPSTTFVARYAGGQWMPLEIMPLSGGSPELAAVRDMVFIIWQINDGFDSDLVYRIWQNGWGPIGFVNEADTTNAGDAQPSISSFGDMGPVVVWHAGPAFMGDYRDIVSSHWTGSGWSSESIISIPDSVVVAIDLYPQVALGPDGRAWASWQRQGPWPENPDDDIWYSQGHVYPPSTSVLGDSMIPESVPLRILRSVPNPSRGFTLTAFVVWEAGNYDAVIGDATGRVVDRVHLGALKPGSYEGERAFRWPLGRDVNPKSGVYFVKFEDINSRRQAVSGKFVLLR